MLAFYRKTTANSPAKKYSEFLHRSESLLGKPFGNDSNALLPQQNPHPHQSI
jgi:hypothetical protein